MIETHIDRTSGGSPVPPDVLEVVESADRMLTDRMSGVDSYPPFVAEWKLLPDGSAGWTAELAFGTPDHLYRERIGVDVLRQPDRAKEFIRDVGWNFSSWSRKQTGELMRQNRIALKQLIAEIEGR